MRVIKSNNYALIPLAYNIFCDDIVSLTEGSNGIKESVSVERILGVKDLEKVIEFMVRDEKEGGGKYLYILDLKNIISYENRIFNRFLELSMNIVIINVNKEFSKNMKEDFRGEYIESEQSFFSSLKAKEKYEMVKGEINEAYHKECVSIVKSMTQKVSAKEVEKLSPLDSSGVYCNMYVNVKKLFVLPERYYFIVYQMVSMIEAEKIEADAFISASRNGANLANIIGWIMGKKVIHCTNLGPKFSLATPNISNEIRRNHNYVYIFDFMCLGTEVKVLNALLGMKEANLVRGYGIGNYIECEGAATQYGVLGKMKSLVDVQKEEFGYRIAGTKEEMKELLKEDKWEDETRLQRI